MIRRALFVVVFALLYTAATLWAMVSSVGAAVGGFEPGSSRASAATIQFFDLLSGALMFPFVSLFAPRGAPWPVTWLLMFGNGVLWAVMVLVLWSAASRRVARRAPETPAA
jgi:hypothetical protein